MTLGKVLRTAPALTLLTVLLSTLASLPVAFGFLRGTLVSSTLLTLSSLFWFGIVPALIVSFIYKERLSEYGFRLPHISGYGLMVFTLTLLCTLLPLLFFVHLPEFKTFYALSGKPFVSAVLMVGPLSLLYYLAEEFFFRGFLLFALVKRMGLVAIPILALIFGLLHVGKPPLEIGFAVVTGLLFSWLALVTRSCIPAALIHWAVALSFTLAVNIL